PILAHVVAEEIHAGYAERLNLPEGGDVHLLWVQVGEEQIDPVVGVLAPDVVVDARPRLLAPGREVSSRCDALRPIDGWALQPLVSRLLDTALEVRLPELVGGNRMASPGLKAAQIDSHALTDRPSDRHRGARGHAPALRVRLVDLTENSRDVV